MYVVLLIASIACIVCVAYGIIFCRMQAERVKKLTGIIESLRPNHTEEVYATYFALQYKRAAAIALDYRTAFNELSRYYLAIPNEAPLRRTYDSIQDIQSNFKNMGILHDYSINAYFMPLKLENIKEIENNIKSEKDRLAKLLADI